MSTSTVGRNEIHALLGENGAGKSTLVKIIYGVMKPDAGEIVWQGQPVVVQNPAHARRLGIGMVFQHFSLFESLTVAREHRPRHQRPRSDRVGLRERITEISNDYGLPLDPDRDGARSVGRRAPAHRDRALPAAEAQAADHGRADLGADAAGGGEAVRHPAPARRRKAARSSISATSSRRSARCATTATIMRLGRVVARVHAAREDRQGTGRADDQRRARRRRRSAAAARAGAAPRLVRRPPRRSARRIRSAPICKDDQLRRRRRRDSRHRRHRRQRPDRADGGAVGRGAGRTAGDDPASTASPAGHMGPRERRKLGGCFVPEERNGHGAVTTMTLARERVPVGLSCGARWRGSASSTRRARVDFAARDHRSASTSAPPGPRPQARALSGGNLQKFLVGREVLQEPGVLVINQPTWGVDAGAAAGDPRGAHGSWPRAARRSMIISQDLDEIFLICDRIAVIAGGRLSPPDAGASDATVEQIGLLDGRRRRRHAARGARAC